MKLIVYLKKFLFESNVHGVGLVLKSGHHLLERLLWVFLIGTSIYFASEVCQKEWHRYQKNSVVLSVETGFRSWEYLVPSITMCTDIFDDERADNFIETRWNLSRSDPNFEIYRKFVEVVTHATYANLQEFRQFRNYSFLNGLDMLEIAVEMRKYMLPSSGFNLVVTEMGVCFSSTYLYSLQNATKRTVPTVSPTDYCRSTLSLESCTKKIYPLVVMERNDTYTETVFLQNKDDVLNPVKAISINFTAETIQKVNLFINSIVASNKLKQLSPAQRRCYFPSEILLKHFNIYTKNLCLISCRIDAAVKYCGCIPFFYSARNVPVCNVPDMACLSHKWYAEISNASQFDRTCNCLPLCKNFEYKIATVVEQSYFQFLPSIELNIICPKKRLKRGVVYSADNLLVSVGGAFGFYLGCSLISVVEFIFFFVEIVIENVGSLMRTVHM